MTDDVTHDSMQGPPPLTPHCAAFDASLPAYLAGRLGEADATEVETHAAECTRCEPVLDAATRRDVTAFAPAVPAALRPATLAAVASGAGTPNVRSIDSARRARVWRIGGSALTLAAAAALTVMLVRPEPMSSGKDERSGQPGAEPPMAVVNAVQQGAVRLATEGAKPELESLDAAARELERALQAAPEDDELRGYLSTVHSRRDELMARVKDAAL